MTLELRLGKVVRFAQLEQTGGSIPGRDNRYAKVTLANRKFSLWIESKAWEVGEEFEGDILQDVAGGVAGPVVKHCVHEQVWTLSQRRYAIFSNVSTG